MRRQQRLITDREIKAWLAAGAVDRRRWRRPDLRRRHRQGVLDPSIRSRCGHLDTVQGVQEDL